MNSWSNSYHDESTEPEITTVHKGKDGQDVFQLCLDAFTRYLQVLCAAQGKGHCLILHHLKTSLGHLTSSSSVKVHLLT